MISDIFCPQGVLTIHGIVDTQASVIGLPQRIVVVWLGRGLIKSPTGVSNFTGHTASMPLGDNSTHVLHALVARSTVGLCALGPRGRSISQVGSIADGQSLRPLCRNRLLCLALP